MSEVPLYQVSHLGLEPRELREVDRILSHSLSLSLALCLSFSLSFSPLLSLSLFPFLFSVAVSTRFRISALSRVSCARLIAGTGGSLCTCRGGKYKAAWKGN